MVFCTFLQLKLKPNINPSHVPSLQHLQHPLQENSSTIRWRITLQYRSIRKSEWLGSMVPSTSTWSDVIWRFLLVVGRTAWRCLHKRFFQKHSIIRSCHMMSPCPSCPSGSQETCTNLVPFPLPTVAKRSEILPDPNQIHPESANPPCWRDVEHVPGQTPDRLVRSSGLAVLVRSLCFYKLP